MEIENELPKKVKIGNQEYAIYQDCDGYLNGCGCGGEIFYTELKMIIKSVYPESRKHETFCHELVHGLRYEAGLMPDRVTDEAEIRPLGAALYSLLRENDFSYMYKGSKPPKIDEDKLREQAKDALNLLEKGRVTFAAQLLKRLAGI